MVQIINPKIRGCGTGISVPKNSNAKITNPDISDTTVAIEERDEPTAQPQPDKIALAVKKPLANFSAALIATIVGGVIVSAITIFYLQPWQDNNQELIQDKKQQKTIKTTEKHP